MYDPNHFVEEREQSSGNYGSTNPNNNNVDRGLYNDLVQIVPLVQSLIDRKGSGSFTRRGSMIYTKTPSQDARKNDPKSRNAAKSRLKKHSDKEQPNNSKNDKDRSADDSLVSTAKMSAEKDSETLNVLRQQLEDLHQKIKEKDELLKAAETSKNEMLSVQSHVEELRRYASEKDSLNRVSQQQLNDAKIKLADKQAALEKLQWEAKTSNQKVERLQEELDSMQSQISSLMLIFEGLSKNDSVTPIEDYDITPYCVDRVPNIDDVDETEMQKMEAAREAYVAAVGLAKQKQDEESLAAAATARLHLQSFVFKNISH